MRKDKLHQKTELKTLLGKYLKWIIEAGSKADSTETPLPSLFIKLKASTPVSIKEEFEAFTGDENGLGVELIIEA